MKERLKNRILGLGIFALVFSLNLIFSGTSEAKPASTESYFHQTDEEPQEIASELNKISIQDGILQHKTELSELHQVVRKFPAALGVLFFLLNQNIEESAASLYCDDPCLTSFSRDLPITYRKLRI